MVTCRPKICYPVIKLSQYSNNPGDMHYKAIKELMHVLYDTIDDGIIYWQPKGNDILPPGPIPQIKPMHC